MSIPRFKETKFGICPASMSVIEYEECACGQMKEEIVLRDFLISYQIRQKGSEVNGFLLFENKS